MPKRLIIACLLLTMNAASATRAATDVTYDSTNKIFKSSSGLLFSISNYKASIIGSQYYSTAPNQSTYSSLTSVDIPDTVRYQGILCPVTAIYDYCFYMCDSLRQVTVPKTVTTIGAYSFAYSPKLNEVTFADGSKLATIDSVAFVRCTGLKTINLEACSQLTSIGDKCFYGDTSLVSLTIPASVKTMGCGAMYKCSGLDTVTFAAGSSIETLDSMTFAHCYNLQSINLEDCSSLTRIDYQCFFGDTLLARLTIPAGVRTIGCGAMYQCYALDTVAFADGSCLEELGSSAFRHCTSLTSINIEACDSLTSIGDKCFSSDSSLARLTIPASVRTIGCEAMYSCSALDTVTFAAGSCIEKLDTIVFKFCYNLKSINLEACDSLTRIGHQCFFGDSSLVSLTVPAGVRTMDRSALYQCSGLETVTFADGSRIEELGRTAFCYCTSLKSINLEDCSALTTIGYACFSRDSMLTELTLPASLTSLGDTCFKNCTGLRSVTMLAESLTTYKANSFVGCSPELLVYTHPYSLATYQAQWSNYATQLRPFYDLSIGQGVGAATLCLPFAAVIPSGLHLYTLNSLNADSTKVCGDEVSDTLRADCPVYVSAPSTAATYRFRGTSSDAVSAVTSQPAVDWLTGVYQRTAVPVGSFVLQKQSDTDGPAFYKVSQDQSIYLNAYRAYLTTDAVTAAALTSMTFTDDAGTTGVAGVAATVRKAAGTVYDLRGVRVDSTRMTPGIYIIDGKKVIIR